MGHVGPFGACGDPFSTFKPLWPILAQSLSGLETVTESNTGPKPVKNDFFLMWPQTLWEGRTDPSGPILGPF